MTKNRKKYKTVVLYFIRFSMNILVLIISNNSLLHYQLNKAVWLSYMNRFPNIRCYFIEYTNDDSNTYPYLEDNHCYLKGEESFDNILIKTLDSIDYFLHYTAVPFDYIVRTNLSSVWDFDRLQDYLYSLPKEGIYTGHIGPYYHLEELYFMFYFIGGMGITMSRDVCEKLIYNREIAESFKNMDDIDIGYTMDQLQIPIIQYYYCLIDSMESFNENREKIARKEEIFYRAKSCTEDRTDEPEYMQKIVDLIYPKDK